MDKQFYQSKTIWSQIILGLAVALIPSFARWASENPQSYAALHGAITVLARILFSNVKLFNKKEESN